LSFDVRLTDRDVDGSPSRKVVLWPQYCPRPADGHRDDGHTGLGGDRECAHVETPQPWGTGQSAFGEDDERLPGSHQGSQPVGAGHAVFALVALDELVAQSPEHESAQPLMLEDFTGDEAKD
jgi:hypothetical protein